MRCASRCTSAASQEGVTSEASSLAGHLGLGRLIVLWDDNRVTIDGSTDLSFTEDVLARYASYGWHTLHVPNGDGVRARAGRWSVGQSDSLKSVSGQCLAVRVCAWL